MPSEVATKDAKLIVDQYRAKSSSTIVQFHREVDGSFNSFTLIHSYFIRMDDGESYTLKAMPDALTLSVLDTHNSLEEEYGLLQKVASLTDIPVPTVKVYDRSLAVVPYPYLLLGTPPGVSLSAARASGKLSPRQLVLLELRTGAYLKQLHIHVQNDWFGSPSQEKDALYSWQEAFTLLLESLLEDAHTAGIDLPFEDVRRYLSRAIGFFLFDDCEVPSLVSFTADEDTTLIDFDLETGAPGGEDEEVRVTSFGSFGHALWGDPLLEAMFLNPTAAFIEGYGGPVILFARQKTKRLWYEFFLALVVLVQAKQMNDPNVEKIKWASETADRCVTALKDAPCY